MEKTPETMMKEFVNSQKVESTSDMMAAMKEMFADVLHTKYYEHYAAREHPSRSH